MVLIFFENLVPLFLTLHHLLLRLLLLIQPCRVPLRAQAVLEHAALAQDVALLAAMLHCLLRGALLEGGVIAVRGLA